MDGSVVMVVPLVMTQGLDDAITDGVPNLSGVGTGVRVAVGVGVGD